MKNVFVGWGLLIVITGLAGCGGGGSDPAPQSGGTKATTGGLVLRPCETTGPGAPPCPASQAAGGAQ